jgi:hypothetical protein
MTNLRGPDRKSVGKPDAGNRHVRFDERGRETGLLVPRPSSTLPKKREKSSAAHRVPRIHRRLSATMKFSRSAQRGTRSRSGDTIAARCVVRDVY